jgi:homocysteine S-methyltransferase
MKRMKQSGMLGAQEGIKIAVELVDEMRDVFQGVYLMPAFNRFDYAAEIIDFIKEK